MTASAFSEKHSPLENSRSQQKASWNNDGNTQMYDCKFYFENNNMPQVEKSVKHIVYTQSMTTSALLRKYRIH